MTYTLRTLRNLPLPHLSRALLSLLRSPLFPPALALLIAACGSRDSITPPPPVPARLEVVRGADQRGDALERLYEDIGIRVLDGEGHAMPDVTVTLAVVDGEGTLSSQEATSDAVGEVHVRWTLGPRTGEQHLRASAALAPSVRTTVTATARAQLLTTVLYMRLTLLDPENGGMRTLFTQFVARNPVWSPGGRTTASTTACT